MGIRSSVTALAAGLLLSACATAPEGTYYASPADPTTVRMAQILHRAAIAGGDDPQRYGFAFIKSPTAAAYSDEDATFYFTDGLMRQPGPRAPFPQLVVFPGSARTLRTPLFGC